VTFTVRVSATWPCATGRATRIARLALLAAGLGVATTACFEATLKTQPTAAGKMVVKFSIASDGHVTEASATGLAESLCTCVADVFRAMKFPKGPGLIHISYPFTFAPGATAVKK
jgi:hypothetical protein